MIFNSAPSRKARRGGMLIWLDNWDILSIRAGGEMVDVYA